MITLRPRETAARCIAVVPVFCVTVTTITQMGRRSRFYVLL